VVKAGVFRKFLTRPKKREIVETPTGRPRPTRPKRAWWLSLLVACVATSGAVDASANHASVTASVIERAQHQAHPATARTGARRAVVSKAVSFTVQNVNRSKLPCRTDGATYQIRGHIVGPRSALGKSSRRRKRAATLYLHGLGLGEFFWSFKQIPGYDYVAALARAGHVSVVIDRLGYDSSAGLDGNQSCLGGQADIAHQIVGQLRSGKYAVEGGNAVRFRELALAGHSAGVLIANIEAYSFKDVDALVIMSFSFASTPFARTEFLGARNACLAGGQPSEPGGPPGYAYFGQAADAFKAIFIHSATQPVIDAASALHNRDPCGDTASLVPALVQTGSVKAIKVPVLVICGTKDALFSPKGCRLQKSRYIGSRDVSLALVKNAAHALTLEREAATFRKKVSRWLTRRGF
jgi:pimeloyl-ACP methyl ester carboxylesterase